MPDANRLPKDLVAVALDFHRRRPWKRAPVDAPFLLRIPSEEWPIVAILIGQDASEFGVVFLRGEAAFQHAVEWCSSGTDREQVEQAEMLSVTFEPFSMIPDELRRTLAAARFQGRRENVAPMLFTKRPRQRIKPPSRGDMRTLVWALRGILAAEDGGHLRPWTLDPARRRVLEITVEGRPRVPNVLSRAVPWPSGPAESETAANAVSLPGELALLPRLDERWVVAAPVLPGRVEGEDGIPRGFLVTVEGEGMICCSEVFLGGDLDLAAKALAGVMQGENGEHGPGLPREIAFESEWLRSAFASALSLLGIGAEVEEENPELVRLRLAMVETDEALARRSSRLPEKLSDWKEVDAAFSTVIAEAMADGTLDSRRARARYFGRADVADEVIDELANHSPIQAYGEWLAIDYRRSVRSKTFLEEVLRDPELGGAERELIERRIAAELSIYRVDETEPGATLTVEDILTGKKHVVHDRSMSGADIEGWFVPLRLCRIREWIFPSVAGPVMGHGYIDGALQFLEDQGVELSPEGMRRNAHLVGRLWGYVLERRRHPPVLQNTDGDLYELHTATFQVVDANAVAQALDARQDVEQGDDRGSWIWFREGAPAPNAGSTTLLGRLDLLGDRLILEVNSARRLAGARQWIDALPGTRFERATRRHLSETDEAPDDGLRDASPPRLDPELQAAAQGRFREMCLAWLDQPAPILGGRTPRDAWRDKGTRSQVLRLIRTMAPATVPGGRIDPPREEMLAALGLRTPEA